MAATKSRFLARPKKRCLITADTGAGGPRGEWVQAFLHTYQGCPWCGSCGMDEPLRVGWHDLRLE